MFLGPASEAVRIAHKKGLSTLIHKAKIHAEIRIGQHLPDSVDALLYHWSVRELERYKKREQGIEDIVATAYSYRGFGSYRSIEPLQISTELIALASLVAASDPEVVMEIGTARGGTFYTWCRYFDPSFVLSLDLPGGDFGRGYYSKRTKLFERFSDSATLRFVREDSHSKSGITAVKQSIGECLIDFLFIDGDHSYDGVKSDFETYSRFVSDGGIIAIHDIVPNPYEPECEVDEFWEGIKHDYQTVEIVADRDQGGEGIGVVFWEM